MADIQSATAESRQGKKESSPQLQNIMACPICDHNEYCKNVDQKSIARPRALLNNESIAILQY